MIDSMSLLIVMPEIVIAVASLVALMAAAMCGARVTRHLGVFAVASCVLAAFFVDSPSRLRFFMDGVLPVYAFGGHFVDDAFARFAKLLILLASSFSILLSWSYFEKENRDCPEYPVLVLFATLGMMLMVSASNLLSLYVGLELQSLSLYVLAAFHRDDPRSSEAGLKYFVLGALASGVLLYGVSLIYGFAGSLDFEVLGALFYGQAEAPVGVIVGMVFVCAALAFKVSGVPFHMWAPDVYEGAPTPVTAFFASAPKFAALALLTRFLLEPMMGLSADWQQIIVFVSIASMIWGAFAGLVQTSLKRLLAYSSIANVGYLLVGLVVGGDEGVQAMLIYFWIYALNVLGIFAVLLCLRRKGRAVDAIVDLSGLSKTHPFVALGMALLLFSLAGVPPLAGFLGKYFIFLTAVRADLIGLAVIGVLTSVVAAYYYLRLIKIMYFDEPMMGLDPLPDWGVRFVLTVSSAAMVVLMFVPASLVDGAIRASATFLVD